MKKSSLILFIALLTISTKAQQEDVLQISFYKSTVDYVNDTPATIKVKPKKITLQEENLLRIPQLLDLSTGKSSKEIGYPWAIVTDSIAYFNFRYSKDLQSPETYIKPDILGRFCVVFAEKEMLRTIASYGPNYGGGLQGVLISESTKWGNWVIENDEKIKIFIVDTKNLELNHNKGLQSAKWKILSRNNFNEILEIDLSKEEINELSIDKVKNIILKKNNAS